MNTNKAATRSALQPMKPARRLAILAIASGGALAIAAPLGYGLSGADGLMTAMAAMFAVAIPAACSLLAAHFLAAGDVLVEMLISMSVRMAAPLAICLLIYLRGGPLVEAGFAFYLIAFYCVVLGLEFGRMSRERGQTPRITHCNNPH